MKSVKINKGFGERFKKLRKELGYSQTDLAKLARVNFRTIHCLETGKHNPNPENLEVLSKILRTTPEYLTYGIERIKIKIRKIPLITIDYLKIQYNNVDPLYSLTKDVVMIEFALDIIKDEKVFFFALPPTDDSMIGDTVDKARQSIYGGEMLLFSEDKKPNNGSIVLAKNTENNSVFVRKLIDDNGINFLTPINPTYSKIKLDKSKIMLLGTLVFNLREYF